MSESGSVEMEVEVQPSPSPTIPEGEFSWKLTEEEEAKYQQLAIEWKDTYTLQECGTCHKHWKLPVNTKDPKYESAKRAFQGHLRREKSRKAAAAKTEVSNVSESVTISLTPITTAPTTTSSSTSVNIGLINVTASNSVHIISSIKFPETALVESKVKEMYDSKSIVLFRPPADQHPVALNCIDCTVLTAGSTTAYKIPLARIDWNVSGIETEEKKFKDIVPEVALSPELVFQGVINGTLGFNWYMKDIELFEAEFLTKLYDKKSKNWNNCKPYIIDQMNVDLKYSLLPLTKAKLRGFSDSYAYNKNGNSIFHIHSEQNKYPFVHVQLVGKSRWYFIPRKFRLQAISILKQFVLDTYSEENGIKFVDPTKLRLTAEVQEILLVYIHAKRLFPNPEYFINKGVEVDYFDLNEGEYVYGDGDLLHWGMNQGVKSLGLAINVCGEDWLLSKEGQTSGPQYIIEFLESVKRISITLDQEMQNRMSVIHYHLLPIIQPILAENSILMSIFLNHCPHQFTCSFAHAIIADISSSKRKFTWTLPVDVLQQALSDLSKVIKLLHDPVIVKTYKKYSNFVCEHV